MADQPLGPREALSCFPTPSPAFPHCGSCGTPVDTHTPGSGEVGASKNQREFGGGVGNVHYNEDIPPPLGNAVSAQRGQGRWAAGLTDALPNQARPPERNGHFKCLSESSGSLALAPLLWWGQGGRDREGVQVPHLLRTASPGPSACGSWHLRDSWGTGTGCPPPAHLPLCSPGD